MESKESRRQAESHQQMPPAHRRKPTQREVFRESFGRTEDWFFPHTVKARATEDAPGKLFCPSCHAISLERRWFLDERRYELLKNDPEARPVLCPGCSAAERGMYDGEVVLSGAAMWPTLEDKQGALNLVRNVESSVRANNPLARLASVEDQGGEIHILTITPFLAHRLVKEFAKAYGGTVKIDNLPDERFVRVRWDAAPAHPEHERKSHKHGRKRAA